MGLLLSRPGAQLGRGSGTPEREVAVSNPGVSPSLDVMDVGTLTEPSGAEKEFENGEVENGSSSEADLLRKPLDATFILSLVPAEK